VVEERQMRTPGACGLVAALTVAVGFLSGCSHRVPVASAAVQPAIVVDPAQDLVRTGCYTCLQQALAVYQRDASGGAAKAFDVAVLLAARQRELGIRSPDYLRTAEELSTRGGDDRTKLLVEVLKALPWPTAASNVAERDTALARQIEMWGGGSSAFTTRLDALGTRDVAATYLRIAVACSWPERPESPDPGVTLSGEDPVLLKYKVSTCASSDEQWADELLRRVPDFVELNLSRGDMLLGRGRVISARNAYETAFRALPASLVAAAHVSEVDVLLEDYDDALRHDEHVLAVLPDQIDALLRKGRALSRLTRHAEAVDVLTQMIAAGSWLLNQAYYWRALNHFELGNLTAAESDVREAERLEVNPQVLALKGFIAFKKNELDRARESFEASLALDATRCDVMEWLGTVLASQRQWRDAATRFASAAACHLEAQQQSRTRIAELTITVTGAADPYRDHLVGITQRALDTAKAREGAARMNAAIQAVHAGELDKARTYATQAQAWTEWAKAAAEILQQLSKR
jgi:tetratricopeptide (TPR) repeat protein